MIDASVVNRVTAMMPFLEPVTFYSRTGGDAYTSYALPQARPRRLKKEEETSVGDAILARNGKVFELYSNVLAAAACPTPKVDDYLADKQGREWTVLAVDGALNDNVFNLVCVKRV